MEFTFKAILKLFVDMKSFKESSVTIELWRKALMKGSKVKEA
jgi:hypothetical protein